MSLSDLASTHVGSIERAPLKQDASGGTTYPADTWKAVAGLASISFSLQPISSREKAAFAQRQVFLSHKVYLDGDYAALIRRSDRVRVTSPASLAGRTYQIIAAHDVAGRGELTMLEVMEMSP